MRSTVLLLLSGWFVKRTPAQPRGATKPTQTPTFKIFEITLKELFQTIEGSFLPLLKMPACPISSSFKVFIWNHCKAQKGS